MTRTGRMAKQVMSDQAKIIKTQNDENMARDKVRTVEELGAIAQELKNSGLKVVHCHGVFDLVHMGHVKHLEAARREGDI